MKTFAAEWIFPVTSPALHQHTIEVDNGTIQNIRSLQPADRYVPGTCIIPGLINAHTHLAYSALRNLYDDLSFFPWIRKLTEVKYQKLSEKDIEASTHLGISECIKSGITTVADLSDLEVSVRELSKSPLRGIFYWEIFGVEREQADQSWSLVQENFPKLVSKYATHRLKIGISPHACFTVRPELYQHVGKWACHEKVPVSFHLAESREEEDFIARRSGPIQEFLQTRAADWKILGQSSVTHLHKTGIFETKPLLAHLVQASNADLDLLAGYEVSVAHCPKSNAKFGHGIAPVKSMMERRIQVCLGTDSAASNNKLDLFEEARFAYLQQRLSNGRAKLSEQQILEMMTIQGARSLNLHDQIGSLDSGKEADLVLLRIPPYYASSDQVLRHIIHNTTSADVLNTIIHGEPATFDFSEADVMEIYRNLAKS